MKSNKLFELVGDLIIDESKETLVFIDKGDNTQYSNTYGTARYIKERLKDKYNIITVGMSCKLSNNYFQLNGAFSDGLYRKKERKDNTEINQQMVEESLKDVFSNIKTIKNIIIGTDFGFRLPSRPYYPKKDDLELHNLYHEYFDYIGNDTNKINKINWFNDRLRTNLEDEVSALAFSTKICNYMMSTIKHLRTKTTDCIVSLVIDPANISFLLSTDECPVRQLYFADDKRGTRDFEDFPLAQFQHILYDNQFVDMNMKGEKTKNLFFGGTVFHTTGNRSKVWEQYLKNVQSDDCSYFVPSVKNNFTKSNKKHIDFLENEMSEMYNDVLSHRHYNEGLQPLDLYKEMDKHKYAMVFRCVSTNDSLNFKPVLYAYKNILPFFDNEYDPSYLQIPKSIQDKLLVKNSEDIDRLIEYFNKNENERLLIIKELRKIFKIDDFINNKNNIIDTTLNNIIKG